MLPGCFPHLCWTEGGIVWIKNPLKDKRLMSQVLDDDHVEWLTPSLNALPSFPKYTCSF